MSRPTSEPGAVLLGHGSGALPPRALGNDGNDDSGGVTAVGHHTGHGTGGHTGRHVWLDATMSVTLLAPPGAAFDDEGAVVAWARRAWLDLAGPADEAAAPEPVAWRAGPRRAAVVGVTWPAAELAAVAGGLGSMAPLWAGVLAHAAQVLPAGAAWRLVVAEGRALTLIDNEDGAPRRWTTLALARDDAAGLVQALPAAAGHADLGHANLGHANAGPANTGSATAGPNAAVWVAGHSLPGELPPGLQALPGLGLPSQPPAALLQALRPLERAEPALRRTPPLAPRLGAALLATALAVLGVAAHAAWDARQAWQAALTRADARERLVQAQQRQQRGDGALQAGARQRLQQPWGLRWAAAEAAQPAGGGWLRLEQRRDAATLLLVGEADTPAEALAVARRIAAAPGVTEAVLLRSEAGGAAAPARFEIGVRVAEEPR